MMKKLIYILIISILIIGIKKTAYASDSDDYTYRIENNYAIITGYTGTGGEIKIPETIDGYIIKGIGEDAFYNNSTITKVKMPDTITYIDSYAFASCEILSEIDISSNLLGLNEYVFAWCPILENLTFPSTLSIVGMDCFKHCPSLTSINVEKEGNEGFFSVDGVLFYNGTHSGKAETMLVAYPGNKSDKAYIVPGFVTYIRSFSSLQNLEKLIIPASVTYMELSAIVRTTKPIDILLKHNDTPDIGSRRAFNNLASGSRIICKNEAVRAEAETSIYGCDAIAILATDVNAIVPATGLELTSAGEITLFPGESKYVSWMQIPEYTTDNVIWKSSDPTGLTIETTGKVTAIYRGTYTVTGEDESGNSISVKVNVSTLTDNGDIIFYSNQNGTWQKHTGSFSVGETYELGFLTQFSGNQQGIYPGTVMISNWSVSGKHKMTTESVSYGQYEYKRTFFTPYEAGSYKISFLQKDKDGIVLALGEAIINVVRDESKLFDLTRCFVELDQYNYSFSGKEIKPRIKGGTILGINQDYYNVTYEHNTFPGVGYVVISGKYGAKGTIREPFYIAKGITKLSGSSLYTKTFGNKDFTLNTRANANQMLQYKSSNTKIAVVSNKGKVTIKGVGTAVITVKVSGDAVYTDAEKKITIKVDPYKIGKVSLTVKRGSKKALLSWKPIKNTSGYEIYRATTKNGKYNKIKTLKKGSIASFTNNKLSRNKIYYYKVRAYRIVNKVTIYGAYSSPKK